MSSDQDIPLEASETREYTPEVFADFDDAPVFVLGSPTSRQKRKVRKMVAVEGIVRHDNEAIRKETLAALGQIWSADDFAKHAPRIEAYWEASDDFQLQQRDDPDLEFDYPEDEVASVVEIIGKVMEVHEPLRLMAADNAEYEEVKLLAFLATTLVSWKGLETRRIVKNGVLTFDCLESLKDDVISFCEDRGLEAGKAALAWMQLVTAGMRRERLTEEKAGNSASPAPSNTSQAPSTSQKGSPTGKSQKSEASEKTPESA